MPSSEPAAVVARRRGAALRTHLPTALVPSRNFRPATSFSAQKTATELGREVSACQS